ncbi:hypothetical protein RJ639_009293 [Escallonia herrerae]|uniref:SAM domain-containing protein n=1 Tax=Escallonia herrerae TaxID=1293975 RepID=A0AA89ASB6_9ASTE|nr:hypothetical protein RJ639_009293 [Escallonia herrerae]
MAETSRSRVTITLGRSGQVVKRVSDSAYSDASPAVGSKRSVRDRLGSKGDANSKRQRGDSGSFSVNAAYGADDASLGKDDLRFKILRKNATQSDGLQNGMDLREILSRPARPSTTSPRIQQHMVEARDGRLHMPESRDSRQQMPESRDSRQQMPEPRTSRQQMLEPRNGRERMSELPDVRRHMPELSDVRQRMPEPKDVGRRMPEPKDVSRRMPEPTYSSIMGRIPSTRSVDALTDPSRNSYSPWTLDRLRRRSPDPVLRTSRALSPPRSEEELQRRPLMRTYEDVRTSTYMSKDALDLSRPMVNPSYMAKTALTATHAKPVAPLPFPPSGVAQKSSYPQVGEHPTVEGLLHSLGLGKYIINFKHEEVDMTVLRQMGDRDLKELGIPMLVLETTSENLGAEEKDSASSSIAFQTASVTWGERLLSPCEKLMQLSWWNYNLIFLKIFRKSIDFGFENCPQEKQMQWMGTRNGMWMADAIILLECTALSKPNIEFL